MTVPSIIENEVRSPHHTLSAPASAPPSPPTGAEAAVASVSVVAMMAIGIIRKRFIV